MTKLKPSEVTRLAIAGAQGVVGYERAKEIAQIVWCRYQINAEKLKASSPSGHRSWVWRVARNFAVSSLREKTPEDLALNRMKLYEERSPLVLLIQREQLAERKEFAWQILRRLSARENMLVTLRVFGGLPWKEVAAIMETKPATLRSIYTRMLNRLREEFATSQVRRVG